MTSYLWKKFQDQTHNSPSLAKAICDIRVVSYRTCECVHLAFSPCLWCHQIFLLADYKQDKNRDQNLCISAFPMTISARGAVQPGGAVPSHLVFIPELPVSRQLRALSRFPAACEPPILHVTQWLKISETLGLIPRCCPRLPSQPLY